jgi:hypothetical protein
MEYFTRLGALLEDAWLGQDRDEERFPEVAARGLAELPPREHLDLEALIDAVLDPHRSAWRQLAPLGAFGQPGVTAYYGRGFVIDVYFWTHANSAIHDHPFRGAFTIVKGESVHARYAFEEQERVNARIRLGRLALSKLEIVGEGYVERFGEAGDPLVHALLHVPIPTVSMVVRTIRTHGYYRYFPPSIALAMDEPDELVGRQLMMLDMLRASGDPSYSKRMARFLSHADFEATFRALSRTWPAADRSERARWSEIAAERHGARASRIGPALEEALRAHDADTVRGQLADADDRLVATLFVLAEKRDQLLGALAARHADPVQRVHAFIDILGAQPEGIDLALHALADGEGEAGALARLRERFGVDAVDDDEARAFCRSSMLSVLARH